MRMDGESGRALYFMQGPPEGPQSPHLQMGRASSPHHPDLSFTPPGAHCQVGGEKACSVLRINVSAIQKYLPVSVYPSGGTGQ